MNPLQQQEASSSTTPSELEMIHRITHINLTQATEVPPSSTEPTQLLPSHAPSSEPSKEPSNFVPQLISSYWGSSHAQQANIGPKKEEQPETAKLLRNVSLEDSVEIEVASNVGPQGLEDRSLINKGSPKSIESNRMFVTHHSNASKQNELNFADIKIHFPHEPYQVQKKYMSKVIEALSKGHNALLQSPTGTGKTLCLLTSVLGWVEHFYRKTGFKTKVIYMSRTHSQLKQVSSELQKTCYRPNMVNLGSRDQCCIKQDFQQLRGDQLVEACGKAVYFSKKIKKNIIRAPQEQEKIQPHQACQFFKDKQDFVSISNTRLLNYAYDMQELKKVGKSEVICPYFYSQQTKQLATLLLMPYNYILDAKKFKDYVGILQDSIVIFDQAHNVAQSACMGRSMTLNISSLTFAQKQLKHKTMRSLLSAQELNSMQVFIGQLKRNALDLCEETMNRPKDQGTFGEENVELLPRVSTRVKIYQLFNGPVDRQSEIQIRKQTSKGAELLDSRVLKPCRAFLETARSVIECAVKNLTSIKFVEKVKDFVEMICKLEGDFNDCQKHPDSFMKTEMNHFRLFLEDNQQTNKDLRYTVGLRCFVPFLTFADIARTKPRSIIMTSGTMNPLDLWEKQLEVNFPVQLSNDHVIKQQQLMAMNIVRGPKSNFHLTFDSIRNNKANIFDDLALTVCNIAESVPNGVLVVFPSTRFIKDFMFYFRKYEKKTKKKVIYEQNNLSCINEFKNYALTRDGALLAIVCRGRTSEGIDFPDGMCRAVIMVGIPFPNISDPFVKQKKEHLNQITNHCPGRALKGDRWYQMGTIRAVNQALGRTIRHINDYGMVFLIDSRYERGQISQGIPSWVTKSMVRVTQPVGFEVQQKIRAFYRNMQAQFGDGVQIQRPKNKPKKPLLIESEEPEGFKIMKKLSSLQSTTSSELGQTSSGGLPGATNHQPERPQRRMAFNYQEYRERMRIEEQQKRNKNRERQVQNFKEFEKTGKLKVSKDFI